MSALATPQVDTSATLAKAFLNAGKRLGLTQSELGQVIGRDRSALHRGNIDPSSKQGELALLLIRVYRSLYVLVGNNNGNNLKHWMKTNNTHTGGIPAEQVKSIPGLLHVLEYLDAIRGKV